MTRTFRTRHVRTRHVRLGMRQSERNAWDTAWMLGPAFDGRGTA